MELSLYITIDNRQIPLRRLTKWTGLPYQTLYDRYKRGEQYPHIIRPAEQRGRERIVQGKTFKQWSAWFAIRNIDVSAETLCDRYCDWKRRANKTDAWIVQRWKDYHLGTMKYTALLILTFILTLTLQPTQATPPSYDAVRATANRTWPEPQRKLFESRARKYLTKILRQPGTLQWHLNYQSGYWELWLHAPTLTARVDSVRNDGRAWHLTHITRH